MSSTEQRLEKRSGSSDFKNRLTFYQLKIRI